MGINKNGEIEIIADFRDNVGDYDYDTEIGLGGKGGYLQGTNILNQVCKELYSVDGVGEARSMDIDDVNSLLKYTGPKGTYINADGDTINTAEAMSIEKIGLISKLNQNIKTPDGKNIGTYKSDYYEISKTDKKLITTDDTRINLVFQGDYFLATSCTGAFFNLGIVEFMTYKINTSVFSTWTFFGSDDSSSGNWCSPRPVVSLKAEVSVSYDTNTGTLTINK